MRFLRPIPQLLFSHHCYRHGNGEPLVECMTFYLPWTTGVVADGYPSLLVLVYGKFETP
jgi:hypothetical protein